MLNQCRILSVCIQPWIHRMFDEIYSLSRSLASSELCIIDGVRVPVLHIKTLFKTN